MAQLLIRNLSDELKERLRRRAELRGASMEAEARSILTAALNEPAEPEEGFGTQFRRYFEGIGMEFELPAYPEDSFDPVDFSK
jgi:plasmid stability protein